MDFLENIKEGFRSIKANMLRSVITALIVVFGITSLVGLSTAVDGIEYKINESLSSLGANSFDIYSKRNRNSSQDGVKQKVHAPLLLNEAQRFIDQYTVPSIVSLSASLTIIAEIKHGSEKTNPQVNVMGANQEYIPLKGLNVEYGRNFSPFEIQNGAHVAIVGDELAKTLYGSNKDVLNTVVSFKGMQFKVIGKLKEKGSISENNFDNMMIIPIIVANQLASGAGLKYRLNIAVSSANQMDFAMGEATAVLRKIRRDEIGEENSFEIEKSESLAEQTEGIRSGLRIGGFGFGFIALLGASIALVNIMLVSVTERTREIGIRKALGATPSQIRQQFIIEAIIVCILGGIGGVLLGIPAGNMISKILGVNTFVIPWIRVIMGITVCIFVGLISGYYPANKASKLDPIESLRFE